MCGIVGYAGRRPALPVLLDGLAQLECGGGDSAGLAVADASELRVREIVEPVRARQSVVVDDLVGSVGVAHTHWGLHGYPVWSTSDTSAGSGTSGRVAVVHDGIVENVGELREKLDTAHGSLVSGTDSEVVAHMITQELESGETELEHAVGRVAAMIHGNYGMAAIDKRQPDRIVVAANGSPLVIGLGNGENFVASGAFALAPFSRQVFRLVDRELAVLGANRIRTFFMD